MASNVVNTMPYLRTSREYPQSDAHQLSVEVNKSYIDIATAVNNRTIGIYPVNRPAINGESWYLTSQRFQAQRQVYPFNSITSGTNLSIPHNIFPNNLTQFTKIYGTCITDAPDYRPIPESSVTANANIGLRITPSVGTTSGNIIISVGAASPNIISGLIILEWISNV